MRLLFTFLLMLLSAGYAFGQDTLGCIDPCATNYNPDATVDDGSCIFPEEPMNLECWQTTTFNDVTCQWDIFGEMAVVDDDCQFTDDSFDEATCMAVNTSNCPDGTTLDTPNCVCVTDTIEGCTEPCATNYNPDATVDDGSCMLPEEPETACYETATFNNTTCLWDLYSPHPPEPILECWETATFNGDPAVCAWEIMGEMPEINDNCDITDDSFDEATCMVINAANCPIGMILDAENCECVVYGGIQNLTFYDANQNQIQDNGEPLMSDIPLMLNSNNLNIYTSNDNLYLLEPGDYTVSIDTGTEWLLTTDSISYFINVNVNDTIPVQFGLYPSELVSNVQTAVYALWPRCNEVDTIDIRTKNLGTTVVSGTTWLQIDSAIVDFSFINEPDLIDNNSTPTSYGWNFTDLYPYETATWQVEILVPGPPDFAVGDLLLLESLTEYTDANGAHTQEGITCGGEVRCSYDPNDKLVNPSRAYDEVLFGEDLIYTIRFQNTGNDVAYDVTILDTLDTNLDWETFRVLGSSHSEVLNTSLDNEGIITFDFQNIFLPDSTANLEGSNGYVTYMMSALDGLAENTVIRNSAGIYFDQNPPILTNTTESVLVSMLTMPIECNNDELRVEVIITTDNYANETLWEVMDTNTNEIYFRVNWGTYPNFLDSTYIHEFCIPQNSCVDFTIRDSYGDGICCDYGEGSYQVILEGDTIATGGNFGSSESVIFHCDSTTVSVIPTSSFPDLTIQPNPNTGTFQVEGIPRGTYNLLNTAGQIIQSGKLENSTLIDISEAAQGVYFIQMMIDEQMVTRRVVKLF